MSSNRSPLTRPITVTDIPEEGLDLTVEANEAERRALAEDFEIGAVHRLEGAFGLRRVTGGVKVSGTVSAEVEQNCVVTLEPVVNQVNESVDLMFSDHVQPTVGDGEDVMQLGEREPPEPIVNGRIDLGTVTAEFLALGLDPYPRKPGVRFEPTEPEDRSDSPFAALSRIKGS
ncbi:MAG: DUF177 domain-containing protein [Pseudomonadota bacterium]|nr:DUF177 domain-containing protein [Pseudomonadota bacterium]